ncbi:acyl carrier protein [Streptococcus sp. X16XC17]|uniref:phosphopantetheine-binding protein n=1 Tax=unclassified Streptococcus TaxID=2608887 RepID=UPI00066FBC33|nr:MULTISPECIES: phosphopantetheine-binding protein [unclassified Streptococcus]TCD45892.1 acyl carrier protein [Streptococcus sp. X16XC17]
MTKEAIFEKIVATVKEQKGADFSVDLDTLLENSVAQDSVEVMEFVLTLEDEFGLDIPDAAIETFVTLSDVVDYVFENKN